MTTFEKNKVVETVLYILNKTGGVDIYHLLKILYFAEIKHLSEWGTRITCSSFKAYEYGPVPEDIYKPIKSEAKDMFPVHHANYDAASIIIPERHADTDYLSKSDIECLDASISDNLNLSFSQLMSKSHDVAWQKAYDSESKDMDDVLMAEAAGASSGTLEYIREQAELFKIVESESYKEAMDDIENGRVYRADSIESMIADCLA